MNTFSMSSFRLDGRNALIIGGGGGIGSVVAAAMSAAGAGVVVADWNVDAAKSVATSIRKTGFVAHADAVDIRDSASVDGVFDRTMSTLGGVDIVVNLAFKAVQKPIVNVSDDDLAETIRSCLFGACYISRAAGRSLIRQGQGGSVIHFTSITSLVALGRGNGIYAATKAGINALVRETAIEWAPHNIRVNGIAPCQTRTPSLEHRLADLALGGASEITKNMVSRIPLGRMAEPHEMAGPCIFLASEASSMITGQILAVDGGYTAQ